MVILAYVIRYKEQVVRKKVYILIVYNIHFFHSNHI